MMQILGRSIWLKNLNRAELVPLVFDYIEAMLNKGSIMTPPPALAGHVYQRYLAPPDEPWSALVESAPDDADGIARLDPVCLMDVDPSTAIHTAEYQGRRIAFCAPSCKKQFVAAPETFMLQLFG